MFGRMCILEIIPTAFSDYVPPKGIDVAWFWDFEGKENNNQVVGFFTSQELSLDNDPHQDGDIKEEVSKNRCFVLIRHVPQSEWQTIIPGFAFEGQRSSVPRMHPNFKDSWQSKVTHTFEAEIDEADYNKMNEKAQTGKGMNRSDFNEHVNPLRGKKEGKQGKGASDNVRIVKDDNPKPIKKIKIGYVSLLDELKAETD